MIKRIFIIAILVGTAFSCKDDFTEQSPIGVLSEEATANETGVNLLLTGAYSALDGVRLNQLGNGFAISPDNWWCDAMSDDAHKGSTDGDQVELFQLETYDIQTSNPYILGKWMSLYAGVNRANAVISLIGTIEEGDFSAQLAEARFLRGYFNFELQKMFGNPAYISEENYANVEFNQPNSGAIWSQVEADFQYAIDNLPPSQSEAGRPTSWAAKSFMGKTQLYQSNWGAALTLFQDVINNGPYSLNAEFVDNFNAAGENSAESIFAVQYAADGGQSLNGNVGGTLNFPGGGPINTCCGFYQPTQDLVNAFQTDGTGLPLLDTYNQTDVTNDQDLATDDPFTPHTGPLDPRLDYTVGRRGIDYNGFGIMPGQEWIRATDADISGPYLAAKNMYQADELDASQGTGAWGQQHSGLNYAIMRYADVLLMAAEAAVETGDLPTALNYVNEVRNRAKNSSYVLNEAGDAPAANYQIEPYGSFANADEARKAVRFERRLELGMEGHRLFDLRRWGVTVDVLNTYVVNETRTISSLDSKVRNYQAFMDLFPIPVTAIDLSGNVLTQNPGY
ncbi:MAG: RagB/SusD family nutrient uptake outer membrane protein [Bacteroidota bacterium]|uniref:RagB/SusD family nutrient uptake outer membrane protein n=1 Tax=Flagellimonas profundi TaxID=2915620 RepID=A0ABS3FBD6_9FLAO|nr:RagB/SusD family nutrient uptake outer membrane protein [Allomuricauda profundi]MBO0340472.1 RagB/SusD family nutrient uptake outer membrane protein [Allomuricauda profundi]MEC7770226.1 RagB/SusD family nutrient uptake outer membrane protein [Bacteroidota bacterium]